MCVFSTVIKTFLQLLILSARATLHHCLPTTTKADVDPPTAIQAFSGFHFLFCENVNRKVLSCSSHVDGCLHNMNKQSLTCSKLTSCRLGFLSLKCHLSWRSWCKVFIEILWEQGRGGGGSDEGYPDSCRYLVLSF